MLRALFRPFLLPLLRRDPGEIARRAEHFAIRTTAGRTLVDRLGRAFLGGYNALLESGDLARVAAVGDRIDPHFRPFYFEGTAMGYLARATVASDCPVEQVERRLLESRPGFRYLYYVGLGFWYGFRHRSRPGRIANLAPHVDPLYLPLCYDGFGFKLGFFHGPDDPAVWRTLEGARDEHAPWIYQGFGRALFFVCMDDPAGFAAVLEKAGEARAHDLELGRSLALGFTGIDRPALLIEHLRRATGPACLRARVLGVAWALAARQLGDPDYFDACVGNTAAAERELLSALPRTCERMRVAVPSYAEWQASAAGELLADFERFSGAAAP